MGYKSSLWYRNTRGAFWGYWQTGHTGDDDEKAAAMMIALLSLPTWIPMFTIGAGIKTMIDIMTREPSPKMEAINDKCKVIEGLSHEDLGSLVTTIIQLNGMCQGK